MVCLIVTMIGFKNQVSVGTEIMIALIASLIGDIINSRLFDLSNSFIPAEMFSTIPFAIAHYNYISILLSGDDNKTKAGFVLFTTPVALLLVSVTQDTSKFTLLQNGIIMVYSPFVGGLLFASAKSFYHSDKSSLWSWLMLVGGALFLFSDIRIGQSLSRGSQLTNLSEEAVIWATYYGSQLCLTSSFIHIFPRIKKYQP